MKVLLSPNPYRDRGLKTAMTAKRILEDNGAQVVICLPFDLEDSSRVHLPAHQPFGQMSAELEDTDVLVCFGGDHSPRRPGCQRPPDSGAGYQSGQRGLYGRAGAARAVHAQPPDGGKVHH